MDSRYREELRKRREFLRGQYAALTRNRSGTASNNREVIQNVLYELEEINKKMREMD